MREIIENIYKKINIQEDIEIIDNIMKQIYLNEGISTKQLARDNTIPIPIATVIKKELIKVNFLKQHNGIRLGEDGKEYVESILGYKNLNIELYQAILMDNDKIFKELSDDLEIIFNNRPQVDVTIDQAKCTLASAINRALLCIENNTLINKTITCLGDDDLISVCLAFLVKKLFKKTDSSVKIIVLEKDKRIIDYINNIKREYDLNIECYQQDLKDSLPDSLTNCSDCIFLDPPYTLTGLELFISRAITLLKPKTDLNIFLSFAHKSSEITLKIQSMFNEMGLVISQLFKNFNSYEGASILGGTSQLMILKTTAATKEKIKYFQSYNEAIYTYDYNQTIKEYQCKDCLKVINVGRNKKVKTIEDLKRSGCTCGNKVFNLIKREQIKTENKIINNGKHLILDCYGCNNEKLNDKEYIRTLMLNTAKIAKASIVTSEFHQFNPYGISGVIIIKESHFTIHTWPEYNYAAIDIFTCGDTLEITKAKEHLEKELETSSTVVKEIEREVRK